MAEAIDGMSEPRLNDAARKALDSYLNALDEGLAGPSKARAAIIEEIKDGLLEAIDTQLDQGASPACASATAIKEFGDPGVVASSFGPELAAQQARRIALAILRTGPLVGLIWGLAILMSPASQPLLVQHHLVGAWRLLPLVGLIIVAIILTAIVAIAASGRLGRRMHDSSNVARIAAVSSGAAVVVGDLLMIGLASLQAVSESGSVAGGPVVLAAAASVARLTLSARAARRCLAIRA